MLWQKVLADLCDGAHGVHHVRCGVQRVSCGVEGLLRVVADRVHRALPEVHRHLLYSKSAAYGAAAAPSEYKPFPTW